MSEANPCKGTILVVEDEAHVLWFISQGFQPLGYTTLTAQSGEEALTYLKACGGKIDLMLIDLGLPGMNGLETIRNARKIQPSVPVIVISGHSDRKTECQALGIAAFIDKPYSLEELKQRIEAVLAKKKPEAESLALEAGAYPSAKILLVDDEPDASEVLRDVLYEMIEDAEFQIRWAQNGFEALKVSKEFQPDIGIIDIRMPEMSGDELIRRFKAGEGYCPRDFIIYTGVSDPDILSRAKELGHRVVEKPADIDTLYDVLRRICIRHHLVRRKA